MLIVPTVETRGQGHIEQQGRAIVPPLERAGEEDPIETHGPRYWELFFEIHTDLPREAPGTEASTRRALALMPDLPPAPLVLDLGCGPGAATVLLAQETGGRIAGLDLHRAFSRETRQRALGAGLEARVLGVHGNMESAPFAPGTFDVAWSEGALYSVGFRRGLEICRELLSPSGHLAVTEAVWLEAEPPEAVRRWWEGEYPAITGVDANLDLIDAAGFVTLDHFTLPAAAWWEYYRPIESRLAELRERHAGDQVALDVLDEAQVEVDMYRRYGGSYGYEFFVCRKR